MQWLADPDRCARDHRTTLFRDSSLLSFTKTSSLNSLRRLTQILKSVQQYLQSLGRKEFRQQKTALYIIAAMFDLGGA